MEFQEYLEDERNRRFYDLYRSLNRSVRRRSIIQLTAAFLAAVTFIAAAAALVAHITN